MLSWFKKGAKPSASTTSESSVDSTLSQPKNSMNPLKRALSKTANAFSASFKAITLQKTVDEDTFDQLEDTLIQSDVGLNMAVQLVDELRDKKHTFKTTDDVITALKASFVKNMLISSNDQSHSNHTFDFNPNVLNIVLVVGVNGAGKTTFIGKLAHQFTQQGVGVTIAAGDTFRAAAEDQLSVWADRAKAHLVQAAIKSDSSGANADPAAVVYDAIEQAIANKSSLVLIDTAGRLQNKFNLMEELRKINQVIQKAAPAGSQQETLLVLDATTGQNALSQAKLFNEAVDLNGVVLTKLDGTAKGGIALAIAQQNQLPVKFVGVGETINDLIPFDAEVFVHGILGNSDNEAALSSSASAH
jgi:fused signal recognition particle receptor